MSAEHVSSFVVKEPAWHAQSTVVDEALSAREAIVTAGMGWYVGKVDVTYRDIPIPGLAFTVRLDTDQVLGVVGSKYKVIQNTDMFGFFDTVFDRDAGRYYHSAGVLRDSRVVWALAKVPGDFYVTQDDRVDNYLLLASSHDGSMGLIAKHTAVRVVCMNTLHMALNDKSPVTITIRHTEGAQAAIRQASRALGLVQKRTPLMQGLIERMRRYQVNARGVSQFLSRLLPAAPGAGGALKVSPRTQRKREAIEVLYADADTNNLPGIEGSAWALYNAATEYVDHQWPARRTTDVLDRTWFGTGATVKAKALRILTAMMDGKLDE